MSTLLLPVVVVAVENQRPPADREVEGPGVCEPARLPLHLNHIQLPLEEAALEERPPGRLEQRGQIQHLQPLLRKAEDMEGGLRGEVPHLVAQEDQGEVQITMRPKRPAQAGRARQAERVV